MCENPNILSKEYWNSRYIRVVDEIKHKIKKIKGIITAFNTNIDAVHFLKEGEIEEIINELNIGEEVIQNLKNPPFKVNMPAEFLTGLINCIQTGRGAEWPIYRKNVSSWIRSSFSIDELRMGGQAGIMANVLAKLGVSKVYPHVAQMSEMQARLFSSNGEILIANLEGDSVKFQKPINSVRLKDEPLIHWIFEFKKGLKVRIDNILIEAPESNRFITAWDEYNSRLEINPTFKEASLKVINEIDKVMISGYNQLRKSYVNGSSFNQYIERTVELISKWKSSNHKIKIHYEQAFLQDEEIIKAIFEKVFPYVDGVGLNEDELSFVLDAYGFHRIAEKIRSTYSVPVLYGGAKVIFEKFNISRVVIHARDFAFSFLRPTYGISPKTQQNALIFGAAVAANRALTGKFGDLREVQITLMNSSLSLSEIGLAQQRSIIKMLRSEGIASLNKFMEDGIFENQEWAFIYVPTKVTDHPVSTVGLGDCFTAGLLIGETE